MIPKSSSVNKSQMIENSTDGLNGYYSPPRHRAQSTIHLLSPDSASAKSVTNRLERSTPSPASSTSSLAATNSPKASLSSFLKVSLSNRHVSDSPPPEDRFVMTIIRSPSTSSQRPPQNEPVGTPTASEDPSNNNKFLKSKVTAALNHMKYRRSHLVAFFTDASVSRRLGGQNAAGLPHQSISHLSPRANLQRQAR